MPSSVITEPEGELFLTPEEASPIVKVSPKTLANWRYLGIGPTYIKLSPTHAGRVRYAESAIRAWLATRKVASA